MPRNVRNFWIDLDVDGRDSRVGTGPRGKSGGFFANIYIRNQGRVERAFCVSGSPGSDGSSGSRSSTPTPENP